METTIFITLLVLAVLAAGWAIWATSKANGRESALRDEHEKLVLAESACAGLEKQVDAGAVECEEAKKLEAKLRSELADEIKKRVAAESARGALEKQVEARTAERDGANRGAADEREKRATVENQLAELRAHIEASKKNAEKERHLFGEERQKVQEDRERMMQKATETFQNLAQDILEKKIDKFDAEGHKRMKETLSPFERDIKAFRERVDAINTEAAGRSAALKREIELLKENANNISNDANNLARALKGESQALGSFGELTLERLLEDSGLRRGEEYEMQSAGQGDEGNLLRPDCLVKLPDDRHLVIDSKASLTDWQDYVSAEDNDERATAIAKHVRAVRRHADNLHGKHYTGLRGTNQPDFVFMFMPIEPAWMAAMIEDRDLFGYAYDKKIILTSRTTLIPTLRVVAQIWKFERQTRNARDIADRAGMIYDKVRVFFNHFSAVGKALENADAKYQAAHNNLIDGRGSLVRQVKRLEELGANIKKSLPINIRAKAAEEVASDKSK